MMDPAHRIETAGSVQALVVDDDVLFAGLEGGEIAAYSLETYELLSTAIGHEDSILSLTLSEDHALLFSTGADSTTNIWSAQSLERLQSLRSYYETGDIFCLTHSSRLDVIFLGAQNGSISWQQLESEGNRNSVPSKRLSNLRTHKFFDSTGPGGSLDPLQERTNDPIARKAPFSSTTMHISCYKQFAHNSYVYSILLVKGLFQHDAEEEVLISGDGGGTIRLWRYDNAQSGHLVQVYSFKEKGSSVLDMSLSGLFLYVGLSNGAANIYNLSSCQLIQRLHVGHGDVTQIMGFNGSILCGTSGGIMKQFNNQFAEVQHWQAHHGKLLATGQDRSSHRSTFATGGNDSAVALWSLDHRPNSSAAESARSEDELLDALRQLVAYRSVSASPKYASECHEAVNFLRKRCTAFGATTSLLSPGDNINPILLAKFRASQNPTTRKTILFYGHYDVVDAEARDDRSWHVDPFVLHPLNGFLYGRGVTDNKGPVLAAIHAAADLSNSGLLSCNVVFLIEGDEEAGSRGFKKTVHDHRDEIGSVDYILLSNSYWLDDHIPCLTFGMRGVVHASISISSNKPDLHSGMDGKSVQHEPLKDLTVVLSNLIGTKGTEVIIPEFSNDVDPLSKEEVKTYQSITSALMKGHPEIKNGTEFADSLMQRWRYPNLTIHRIEVPEAKTAVTISGTAKATLSIRIVPSQTAEETGSSLTRYLERCFARLDTKNVLKADITSSADPWLGNIKSNIYRALKEAIVDVWSPTVVDNKHSFAHPGSDTTTAPAQQRSISRRASSLASHGTFTAENTPSEPLYIREGGSIPAISFLEKEFDAPAAMFPMGQASDNAHLDNERIRVENLSKGRDVLRRVFSRI